MSQKLRHAERLRTIEPPKGGWLRAIRTALDMPQAFVAARLGVSQAAIAKYETSEKDGTIQLASLRKAARAMDCDLVYAILPRENLEEVRLERAKELARRTIKAVAQTMALEDQSVPDDGSEDRVTEIARVILAENPRSIWDL